jgi:hypothetical protein
MKWTTNDFEISVSKDLSCAAMSLISIMCSHTPLDLLCFIIVNLFIRVLANALLELTNCSSMAFK